MKVFPVVALSVLFFVRNAPAQSVEKTVYFVHLNQDLPDVAAGIRVVAGLAEAQVDSVKKSLTLRGSPDQVALGEWLFKSLDVTDGQGDPNVGAPYRVSGSDDAVRLFYLTYAGTVQEQQEVATLIRTIGEVKRVWVYPPQKALVLRGTAEQLAMAEWISTALDRHKQGQSSQSPEFRFSTGVESVVRLYWASTPAGITPFQQMATAVRTTAEIRRVFTYNEQKVLAARGTADQLDLAAWLVTHLDQPAHAVPSPYTVPDSPSNLVRIFYVRPAAVSPANRDAEFQKIAAEVHTSGKVRQVFTYTPTLAIVVRGTEDQMMVAEKMLEGKVLASLQ